MKQYIIKLVLLVSFGILSNQTLNSQVNGPCPVLCDLTIYGPLTIALPGGGSFTITYEQCGDVIKIKSLSYTGVGVPNVATYMNTLVALFGNMPLVNTLYMDGNCAKWTQTSAGAEFPGGGFKMPTFRLDWCSQVQCCVLLRDDMGVWSMSTMDYGSGDCTPECFPACPY